ncbi:MAG: DUF2520 domain-containing protein [Bdellovibrionales bacterium]|nr:DUF2520 domain-containing protein [Bdellovibrionales bacterium]
MAKRLSVVGCGKVAQTLCRLWANVNEFQIEDIYNRSFESAERAARSVGAGRPLRAMEDLAACDMLVIGVPDDSIHSVAAALAQRAILRPGTIVFHLSGALTSDALQVVDSVGARRASVHPVKTFADVDQASATFVGTLCSCEGNAEALPVLDAALRTIGARPFSISSKQKLLYHAAFVFTSNYLVTLLECGVDCLEDSGVDRSLISELLQPLMNETIENVLRKGAAAALTGPIARGDTNLVRQQLAALESVGARRASVYRALGLGTAQLAYESHKLEESQRIALENILREKESS